MNNDKSESKKLGIKLYETYNFSSKDLAPIHIFPKIRYLAYKLFYLTINGTVQEAEKYEIWLLNYVSIIILKVYGLFAMCSILQFHARKDQL